jgi:hypothetical protein
MYTSQLEATLVYQRHLNILSVKTNKLNMSPINPQNTSFYKKKNNKLVAGNKVKQYP